MNFQLDRTNQQCSNQQQQKLIIKQSSAAHALSVQRDSAARRQLNRLWEHVKWYWTAWHTHSHTMRFYSKSKHKRKQTFTSHITIGEKKKKKTNEKLAMHTVERWPGKMVQAFARWMSKYCETHTEIEQNEKYATAIAIIQLGSTMATTATTATTTRTHYEYNGLNDRNAVRLSVLAHFCSANFSCFFFVQSALFTSHATTETATTAMTSATTSDPESTLDDNNNTGIEMRWTEPRFVCHRK